MKPLNRSSSRLRKESSETFEILITRRFLAKKAFHSARKVMKLWKMQSLAVWVRLEQSNERIIQLRIVDGQLASSAERQDCLSSFVLCSIVTSRQTSESK